VGKETHGTKEALNAPAEKASSQPHYRFKDWYRCLNREVLHLCFYHLRKETRRTLYQWLNRRSQRRSLRWEEWERMLQRSPILMPWIREKPRQRMPYQLELSFCQRLMRSLPIRGSHGVVHARAS
jgi:hypothetical protein